MKGNVFLKRMAVGVSASLAASGAYAAGPDFSALTAALDSSTVMAAISAAAAIKLGPGFARWAYSKLISWFR